MPAAELPDRALIDVSGPEGVSFLQNVVTTDLDALNPGEAKPGALLSPQGKILFDFLVTRDGADGLVLDTRADIADELIRRLTLYRLRAKAQIIKRDQSLVFVSWEDDSSSSHSDSTFSQAASTSFADTRFPPESRVRRHYGPVRADAATDAWHALRVSHGIAESGTDYELGDAFPHDVLLDQTGGVGFRKGCYVGQEVVSRMQHRGTARRRVLIATSEAGLPEPGTALTADGRALGQLGSVSDTRGLAIARIDRVKDAMDAGVPILAGETEIRLDIPGWAGFGFPGTDGAEAG